MSLWMKLWNVLYVLLCIVKLVMTRVEIRNVVTVDKNLICLFTLKKSKFKMMNLNMKIHHKNDINSGCVSLKIVGRWYMKECEMKLSLEIRLYIQDVRLMLYIYDCTNWSYKTVYYDIMLNQYYMKLNHVHYISHRNLHFILLMWRWMDCIF
jgi:hypothetical protein